MKEEPCLHPNDVPRMDRSLELLAQGALEKNFIDEKLFLPWEIKLLAKSIPSLGPRFREAEEQGREARQRMREEAADKRAIEGVAEPIYSVKGEYLGDRIRHSDQLLAFMLKANNPEKYGDRSSQQVNTGLILNVNLGIVRGGSDDCKRVEATVQDAHISSDRGRDQRNLDEPRDGARVLVGPSQRQDSPEPAGDIPGPKPRDPGHEQPVPVG